MFGNLHKLRYDDEIAFIEKIGLARPVMTNLTCTLKDSTPIARRIHEYTAAYLCYDPSFRLAHKLVPTLRVVASFAASRAIGGVGRLGQN